MVFFLGLFYPVNLLKIYQNRSLIFFFRISTAAEEVIMSNVSTAEPVELYEEVVEADPVDNVPSDLIQINANLQEVSTI